MANRLDRGRTEKRLLIIVRKAQPAAEFLDEDKNQNDCSADHNFNQTPDISSNFPSDLSKPVENICDLSATDFKQLLDEIISNFNHNRAADKT